jgi:AmiR/NasT family two-component response regulator
MDADRLRVLIADDDRPFTLLTQRFLENSGFEVVGVVHDGHQAVDACRRTRPDVILLDINMPGLDGISVARRLAHEAPRTTLIVLSSMDEEELIEQAIQIGIPHYQVKPVSRDQLRACILTAVAADRRWKDAGRKLHERKVVERAKGLLMDRNGMSEAGAYRFLRTESQKRRIAIYELSDMLLLAEELHSLA